MSFLRTPSDDLGFSPAQIGFASGVSGWQAGNFGLGVKFKTDRPRSMAGVRFWARFAGTKNLKVSCWHTTGSARLATRTVSVTPAAAGEVVTVPFDLPLLLAPNEPTTFHFATVWDASGSHYCGILTNGTTYLPGTAATMLPGLVCVTSSFAAGDAFPGSDSGFASAFYCVEPFFS